MVTGRKADFKLLGDDYDLEGIRRWYEEEEAYHDQFQGGRSATYWSVYELFNRKYALERFVRLEESKRLLSFGCAEGNETQQLRDRHRFQLYGIDASVALGEEFVRRNPHAIFKKARMDGVIDFPSEYFDYVLGFGVLHHVPNVSFVLVEIARVLRSGGRLVLREPIAWMYHGSTRPPGISPRERGIPTSFLLVRLQENGLRPLSVVGAYYRPLFGLVRRSRLLGACCARFPLPLYWLDRLLCRLPSTGSYETKTLPDRFQPGSAYYVAQKP